jgi:pimeloyl-ACP methyl ester carboxylesterase
MPQIGDKVKHARSEMVYEISSVSPEGDEVNLHVPGTNLERFRVRTESLTFVERKPRAKTSNPFTSPEARGRRRRSDGAHRHRPASIVRARLSPREFEKTGGSRPRWVASRPNMTVSRPLSESEFYDDVKMIDVPVLVMHGEDDQICPSNYRSEVGEALEARHAQILSGDSHMECPPRMPIRSMPTFSDS